MRHEFLVLTVKKLLKSVYIYGSYRKNQTGIPFFWNTLYVKTTELLLLLLLLVQACTKTPCRGYVRNQRLLANVWTSKTFHRNTKPCQMT